MNGIFGDSAEDRARERELHNHLDAQERAADMLEAKIEARKEEIYGDMKVFEDYLLHGYEGLLAISRQLNRALCLAGKTDDASMVALHDAVKEMKAALDAHIEHTVRVHDD